MSKLVVEVVDSSDLMPKDSHGSASPFVEVNFDDQRQRTQTKNNDLNPYWNEKLVFNVTDPSRLPSKTIDLAVYNDRKSGQRNFVGRVRIAGVSVLFSESESAVQRYPLDKRNPFSHIKEDIALRTYAVHDVSSYPPPSLHSVNVDSEEMSLQEINTNEYVDERNRKKKKKEVKTFFSIEPKMFFSKKRPKNFHK